MEQRNLGNSGLKVSVAGLGCNNFGMRIDFAAAEQVVNAALDAGITLFDTADVYGQGQSEEMLGKALGGRRHEVVVATKFGMPMGEGPLTKGASRRYIVEACEASLRRLDTDYIDVYQVHFPDAETPVEETLRALDDLVRAGKVRYIGNSNYAGWQLAEAHWTATMRGLTPFVSAQNHYNMIARGIEAEVIPACEKYGLGLLPYFPLASGFLTGKYKAGEGAPEGSRLAAWGMAGSMLTEGNFATLAKIEAFGEARGRSVLEVAVGWLASKPYVASVISGATRPDQLASNASAANDVRFSAEELAELDGITA